MKQVTIYCSPDLEGWVTDALDRIGVDGFVRLGDATGHIFQAARELPRTLAWDATVVIVPAVDDARAEQLAGAVRHMAGNCEVGPCLRLVVTPVERVL